MADDNYNLEADEAECFAFEIVLSDTRSMILAGQPKV